MNSYKKLIEDRIDENILVTKNSKDLIEKIEEITKLIIKAMKEGRKLLIFGNGGSASDAQHFAGELVNTFKIKNRRPLPAISLTTDTSVITSISNDYTFDYIFSKQIEAIGKRGDIAFAITTSGNSTNVIKGIVSAKKIGLITVALTGNNGGKIVDVAGYSIIIPSKDTARIQEVHTMLIHIVCEIMESELCES